MEVRLPRPGISTDYPPASQLAWALRPSHSPRWRQWAHSQPTVLPTVAIARPAASSTIAALRPRPQWLPHSLGPNVVLQRRPGRRPAAVPQSCPPTALLRQSGAAAASAAIPGAPSTPTRQRPSLVRHDVPTLRMSSTVGARPWCVAPTGVGGKLAPSRVHARWVTSDSQGCPPDSK